MDVQSIVGYTIGLAGLIYAIYQGREYKKLKSYNRSEAWIIYENVNNLTGGIQFILKKYKEVHSASMNIEIIEYIARNDTFAQNLIKETIRQIQLSEPRFNMDTIKHWISLGKISETQEKYFNQFVVDDFNVKK
ncbi:MAG: hypothetical protein HQK88_11940 [Nitrospirae bacterium]|nr:hypothetical protein [Nitrospirota bacterium]MBF0535687.1 hypothetical protein [Nitrospirota bacterium]MBF0617512.1 hypothetical protein [Nitrospirota bacterium]